MATRAEAVMADIAAEMVARGVDVPHSWGKLAAEQRKKPPYVEWVEQDDEAEVIEPPFQTRYETDAGQQDASYDRAVRVQINVVGRNKEQSETIADTLLASGYVKLTMSAWAPARINKRGERPSSGGHVRVIDVLVRVPVLDVAYQRGNVATTTLAGEMTDAMGQNPTPFE